MPSFLDNYSLARQVAQLKYQTTSSHDIIDRTELPALYPEGTSRMELMELRYGKARLDSFRFYDRTQKALRFELGRNVSSKLQTRSWVIAIAITIMGLGECGELSARVGMELLKRNRQDFYILTIKNELFLDQGYNHMIVVLGVDLPILRQEEPLSSYLQSLPNECVVIDLLLNHVGPAKTLLQDQADYYNTYKLRNIYKIQKAENVTQENLDLLEENAHEIVQSMGGLYPPSGFMRRTPLMLLFHLPSSSQKLVPRAEQVEENNEIKRGILTEMKYPSASLFFEKKAEVLTSLLPLSTPSLCY